MLKRPSYLMTTPKEEEHILIAVIEKLSVRVALSVCHFKICSSQIPSSKENRGIYLQSADGKI
jgi:hypothetical protein